MAEGHFLSSRYLTESSSDGFNSFNICEEKLMTEVLKRPELYDKTSPGYKVRRIRQMLWAQVYPNVVDNWGTLSADEQLVKGTEVEKLWNHLSGTFMRRLIDPVTLFLPNVQTSQPGNIQSGNIQPSSSTSSNQAAQTNQRGEEDQISTPVINNKRKAKNLTLYETSQSHSSTDWQNQEEDVDQFTRFLSSKMKILNSGQIKFVQSKIIQALEEAKEINNTNATFRLNTQLRSESTSNQAEKAIPGPSAISSFPVDTIYSDDSDNSIITIE